MQNKFHLTLEQNLFLAKKILVGNIYNSAKQEGVNATYPETETILEGVNIPTVKLDDIQIILNLRDAWRFVLGNIADDLNLDFVCQINENISRNYSLEWGKLRTGPVGIGGTTYAPPIPNQPEAQAKITEILSRNTSTTEKALDLLLYLSRAQLFWDGNKRTANLAANKLLISSGAGVFTVAEEHLAEFNNLLTDFYNTGESTKIKPFLYERCIVGLTI
ncbi:MAG: Fic family protein [Candidatus Nomurabacteria bacterium]|jgi:hypothetical protein|nr:Fic family protein [Candidatus Nomurabacteria bacterium]